MRLDYFANHATAKKCKLTKPEVLALRFYTTAGFRSINDPLRDMDRKGRHEAHPLPNNYGLSPFQCCEEVADRFRGRCLGKF